MRTLIFCLLGFLLPQAHADQGNELQAIRMVESSGGMNLNHAVVMTGIHKGTRAGGEFGIMPITARELLSKSKALISFRNFMRLNNDRLTDALNKNRKLDQSLASTMWNKLRHTRDADQSACAWFRGPGSELCKDAQFVHQDPYVLKFRSALEQIEVVIAHNR